MRFLPVSTNAMLVELADLDATLMLFEALKRAPMEGIEEIVPAARTLTDPLPARDCNSGGAGPSSGRAGSDPCQPRPRAAHRDSGPLRRRGFARGRGIARHHAGRGHPPPHRGRIHRCIRRLRARLRLHGRAGSGPRGPTPQNAAHAHSGGGRGACWAIQRYLPPRESRRVADHRHDAACHVRPRPRAPCVAATR